MLLSEKLIEVVKNYPILYDLSHEEYKNSRKKDKLWKKLGVEMNSNGNQLKKKWKNLRDTYAKHLKSCHLRGTNVKKNYKNWQWAKEMEFFRPFMPITNIQEPVQENENCQDTYIKSELEENLDNCDMVSEFSVENIENDKDFDESLLDSEMNTCAPDTSKSSSPETFDNLPFGHIVTKKNTTTNRHIERTNKSNGNKDYLSNERIAELDPIELILLSYAKTIKTFSPRRQAITKLKFAQIMMEQECEHYTEETLN